MTMDYGLTPAEQAAQRATQRADDTRRRRTESIPHLRTYQGMTRTDPGDFGGTPKYTTPQIERSPITPSVRTAPMTGPTIRTGTDVGVDWTPVWGGAREPNVPVDLSRAGGTTRPVPLPQPNIMPHPRFPSILELMNNARPVPMPTPNTGLLPGLGGESIPIQRDSNIQRRSMDLPGITGTRAFPPLIRTPAILPRTSRSPIINPPTYLNHEVNIPADMTPHPWSLNRESPQRWIPFPPIQPRWNSRQFFGEGF